VSTAVEKLAEAPEDEGPALDARALLRVLWADPQHMAEHLAVWSLDRFGPRAADVVETISSRRPDVARDELERLVIERQTRVAMTEGAFVGGPFIVLIPVAFCAALLAQAQMVYALAAVAGRSPTDRMRAAELLVLLGAYPSTEDANAAVKAMTSDAAQHEGGKLPAGTRIDMVRRMAYLLGVLGTTDESRSRLRNALGWAGIGVLFLVGLVLPLVWVPYMAYSTRRSTLRIARRAQDLYAPAPRAEVERGRVVSVGGTAGFVRAALVVLLPVGAGLVALLSGLSLAGGELASAGLLLLFVSAVVTLGWLGLRRWRRRPAFRTSP
jgi:hypothetical protein